MMSDSVTAALCKSSCLPPDIQSSSSLTDLPQTEDMSVPPIISRHFALTICTSTTLHWTL